jgi:hypothetical protein
MAVSKSLDTLTCSSPIVCFFSKKINVGPTGIRTQVARFKVWSDNHYTMEPFDVGERTYCYLSFSKRLDHLIFEWHFTSCLFCPKEKIEI